MERTSELILASASSARRRMLESAGVAVRIVPSSFDEAPAKAAAAAVGLSTDECVAELALGKACDVSVRQPGALVIGADQMLEFDGRWFDKAPDLASARRQLLALRGQTHRLVNAVVLVRDRIVVWRYVESAHLRMRNFTADFLDRYLAACGPRLLHSIGCYEIEAEGAQLFDSISGDYFTIQGLALLPLLAALRGEGAMPT